MLQFPTYSAYDNAIRVIGRKGRLYKLDRVCCSGYIFLLPKEREKINSPPLFSLRQIFNYLFLFTCIRLNDLSGILLLLMMGEL